MPNKGPLYVPLLLRWSIPNQPLSFEFKKDALMALSIAPRDNASLNPSIFVFIGYKIVNTKGNFTSIGVVVRIILPITSPRITLHFIIDTCALSIFFTFIVPISIKKFLGRILLVFLVRVY